VLVFAELLRFRAGNKGFRGVADDQFTAAASAVKFLEHPLPCNRPKKSLKTPRIPLIDDLARGTSA